MQLKQFPWFKNHKDKVLGFVNPPSVFYDSIINYSDLHIPYLRLKIDDPITTKSLSRWSFGSMYIYEINYLWSTFKNINMHSITVIITK